MQNKSVTLEPILTEILDAIHSGKKARLSPNIYEHYLEVESFISQIVAHRLEGVLFDSIDELKVMNDFYHDTYHQQLTTVIKYLSPEIIASQSIFIQGFSRYHEYEKFYSQGLRSDIDIYIPKSFVKTFYNHAKIKGFMNYTFDDESFFLPDEEHLQKMESSFWAIKDFTIKYIEKTNLPSNLVIDIDKIYFPYIYRNDSWCFVTSLEVHHEYTHTQDTELIERSRSAWHGHNFFRTDITTTLYYLLLRLWYGVLNEEKRMRLVVDIACAIKNRSSEEINMVLLKEFFTESQSEDASRISTVVTFLISYHPLFSFLKELNLNINVDASWVEKFKKTMVIN